MQQITAQKPVASREFSVGIIGASPSALAAFNRIFSVTAYRIRAYRAVAIASNASAIDGNVDIFVLCANNPNVMTFWFKRRTGGELNKPLIRLDKLGSEPLSDEYIVPVPLNPSRFLKTLDDYTIKELKFFPEFEIGRDDGRVSGETLAGIRLLKGGVAASALSGLKRALVVDDSLPVRKQIEIEFSLLGVQSHLCESAEVALEQMQRLQYDVIFLDVVMPGMDGIALSLSVNRLFVFLNVGS
ncbi:MAG TPA: response regulator, partial [Marinagarivorans sp.]